MTIKQHNQRTRTFVDILGFVALMLAIKLGGPLLQKAMTKQLNLPGQVEATADSRLRTDVFLNDLKASDGDTGLLQWTIKGRIPGTQSAELKAK